MIRFPMGAAAIASATRAIAAMAVPASLVLLSFAGMAQAQERILAYDSMVEVRADGSLDVVETIAVRAEGS